MNSILFYEQVVFFYAWHEYNTEINFNRVLYCVLEIVFVGRVSEIFKYLQQ